jgi:hypothetical protein
MFRACCEGFVRSDLHGTLPKKAAEGRYITPLETWSALLTLRDLIFSAASLAEQPRLNRLLEMNQCQSRPICYGHRSSGATMPSLGRPYRSENC